MGVQKDIVCPHCKKLLSPVGGFYHDEEQNMLCVCCNGVIFAATESQERRSKYSIQGNHHTATTYSPYNGGYNNSQYWNKKELLPIRLTQVPTSAFAPDKVPVTEGEWGCFG